MKQKGKAVLRGSRWKNYLSFNSTSGKILAPGQMAEKGQKTKKRKNWEKSGRCVLKDESTQVSLPRIPMLCFSLLDFLMPPLAFVFFYFLFSVSALHWFSSSTNHQHCSVLLCCNCNAHLYFHLITTVHTLIIREAANKIKANWIMWENEQKNGGKETRRERKEGGADSLSNECNNTSDSHLLSHEGKALQHKLQRKHGLQNVIIRAPLTLTDTSVFTTAAKMNNIIVFGFFPKL